MKPIPFIIFLLFTTIHSYGINADWEKIENEHIVIGVDKSRGACIGWLGEKSTNRNLLNHFDEGRFLQQSYYGKDDGSRWEGRGIDWVYNAVQGGSWDRQPAELLELMRGENILKSIVRPRHWATAELLQNIIMTSKIMLEGKIAHIQFGMVYTGPDQGKARHQEVPAFFVDGALSKFHYTKNGVLTSEKPRVLAEGKKAEIPGLRIAHTSSEWVAYTDENDWGIGLYTPGTTEFTCYTARGDGSTGPNGSSCSYVAPIKTFTLTPGLTFEYEIFLTIGALNEIKTRFENLKK